MGWEWTVQGRACVRGRRKKKKLSASKGRKLPWSGPLGFAFAGQPRRLSPHECCCPREVGNLHSFSVAFGGGGLAIIRACESGCLLLGCCAGSWWRRRREALACGSSVVLKKERTLQLLSDGKVIKSYKVALGGDPRGRRRGREITRLRGNFRFAECAQPISQALHISYPNARICGGEAKGFRWGVFVTDCRMGMDGSALRTGEDWTDGCIAVRIGD